MVLTTGGRDLPKRIPGLIRPVVSATTVKTGEHRQAAGNCIDRDFPGLAPS